MSPHSTSHIASRIRDTRRAAGLRQQDVARAAGIPLDSYRSYEQGKVENPPHDRVAAIFEAIERLTSQMQRERRASTEGGRVADTEEQVAVREENGISDLFTEDMRLVIYKHVRPAAGTRRVMYFEEDREILHVPKGFILRMLGFIPPSSMGVAFIDGDSMSPSLEDGDMVLYRPMEHVEGAGIYMLIIDGALVAKRVHRLGGGGYLVISDNKYAGYPDERYIPNGDEMLVNAETGRVVDMRVVGRVVWPRRSTDKLHIKQVQALIQGLMNGSHSATAV